VIHSGAEGCPNGAGALVLVAIGHTLDRAGGRCAPAGVWRLTLRNARREPTSARLWIERRDAPGELPGYRPQYGLGSEGSAPGATGRAGAGAGAGPAMPDLGSMAGGRRTVVVGAHWTKEDAAAYSARGSDLRTVDLTAAGRRAGAGFFTGTCKDLQGTSFAAARVSGALLAAGADVEQRARLGVGGPAEVRGTRSAPVSLPERK
jgi:hypothetical protein